MYVSCSGTGDVAVFIVRIYIYGMGGLVWHGTPDSIIINYWKMFYDKLKENEGKSASKQQINNTNNNNNIKTINIQEKEKKTKEKKPKGYGGGRREGERGETVMMIFHFTQEKNKTKQNTTKRNKLKRERASERERVRANN